VLLGTCAEQAPHYVELKFEISGNLFVNHFCRSVPNRIVSRFGEKGGPVQGQSNGRPVFVNRWPADCGDITQAIKKTNVIRNGPFIVTVNREVDPFFAALLPVGASQNRTYQFQIQFHGTVE
jgi:hypothetical protein